MKIRMINSDLVFKKKRNVFDYKKAIKTNLLKGNQDDTLVEVSNIGSAFVEVESGKTVKVTRVGGTRFCVYLTAEIPSVGVNVIRYTPDNVNNNVMEVSLDTTGARYMLVYFYNQATDTTTTMDELGAKIKAEYVE